MSNRPLVFVSALTLGDYLLWHWSLNSNHDVLALISGLSLPPLGVAWLWLLALGVARLIAARARMPALRRNARSARAGGVGTTAAAAANEEPLPTTATATTASSDKLAA